MVARELGKIKDVVFEILMESKESRNSDDVLYLQVCEAINPGMVNLPFNTIMKNRKSYGFPAFESVGRVRRKIQEEHPELAACADVEAARMLNEEGYKEFARG